MLESVCVFSSLLGITRASQAFLGLLGLITAIYKKKYWALMSNAGVVLGCVGLYWAITGCAWLYWAVLGCTELYWAVLGFTGMYLALVGCSGL